MKKSAAKIKKPGERVWELDFLRGLCVLLMVFDHTLYDLGFVFYQDWFLYPEAGGGLLFTICRWAGEVYWFHPVRAVVRVLVLAGFIGLCGLSCSFSRSNWKRGLKLLAVALLLTAATAGLDRVMGLTDGFIIRWGVLHMLAASILLYAALRPLGLWPLVLIGLVLAAAGWWFSAHPLGPSLAGFIIGLGPGSYSADYFPLLPWCGYFLLGAVVGPRLYPSRRSRFPGQTKAAWHRGTGYIGRHALIIYVLHQPLVYAALLAVGWLLGYPRF